MTTTRNPAVVEAIAADRVVDLGPEWEDLRRATDNTSPFLTWAWIGAWIETKGRSADLAVVTARDADSGSLLGIAPFYVADTRRRGVPLRELRVLGSDESAPDHLDMLVRRDADPRIATELWNTVTAHPSWHLIDLDGLAAGGHLARVAARRRLDHRATSPCPYLPLDGGWEAVEKGMGSRVRNNLRRYGRKLDRDAETRELLVADHRTLDATFDHLVEFHQTIRTSKGDAGVFASDGTREFLRLAAHRLLDAGRLRMWRLDADDTPIAAIWCMRSGDIVSFYTTGYDPAWAKYGPGRRIMARALRGAIDEGATEFDFLRGVESYKQEWGTLVRDDIVIRRPTSGRGRLIWLAATALGLTRRAR